MKISEFDWSGDPHRMPEGQKPYEQDDICLNCKFYEMKESTDHEGKCRRYAPKPPCVAISKGHPEFTERNFMTKWAIVSCYDWCGDFIRADWPIDV